MKIFLTTRRYFLCIVCLGLFSGTITAQESNGVYALQESLEEAKKEIDLLERKSPVHDNYDNVLKKYLGEVASFDPDVVKKSLDVIEKRSSTTSVDEIIKANNAIVGEMQKLSFVYRSKYREEPLLDNYETQLMVDFTSKVKGFINESTSSIESIYDASEDVNSIAGKTVSAIKELLKNRSLETLKESLKKIVEDEVTSNQQKKKALDDQLKMKKKDKTDIISQMSGKDKEVNALSIKLGLPLFCITVVLLFLGSYVYQRMSPKEAGTVSGELISKVMLEVTTVLLITMSVLILGLAKILHENVLGTLLGAIAGYILNRSKGGTTAAS